MLKNSDSCERGENSYTTGYELVELTRIILKVDIVDFRNKIVNLVSSGNVGLIFALIFVWRVNKTYCICFVEI